MSFRPLVVLAAALLLAPALPAFAPVADAARPTLPVFTTYVGPTEPNTFGTPVLYFNGNGGEPSVGVSWETGTVHYVHGFRTYRVAFGPGPDSAWEDVTPPNTVFNVDPMLFTDSATGRVFTGGLDGHCSVMAYSDDDGETWTPTGNMCVPTLDHQSIAAGPWKEPRPLSAIHDRGTYYCGQSGAVSCITSYDGGLTWGPAVAVTCGGALAPGLHGSVHVSPLGHVYVPFRNCAGGAGFAVSQNNGLSFLSRRVPGAVHPGHGFDPDVATTPSGWLYMGYANGTGRSMAIVTKDDGATWNAPVDVGAPLGILNSTFHEMVAGDDERAMLAFLGTTTPGDAWSEAFEGDWHLYVATTVDGGASWTTIQVSTDPVKRGWICDQGTGCPSAGAGGAQAHRNLLDFMDAQVDPFGRVIIAYADGCFEACALPGGTVESSAFDVAATISYQTGGPSLFSRFDATTGEIFASGNGPYLGETGTAVPLTSDVTDGASPIVHAWELVTRPRGSFAGAASFGTPDAPTTTFTPDVAGDYRIRLEVRDALGEVATDVVTVTAVAAVGAPLPPCGVALASDPAGDSSATGAGVGRRDLVALAASDDATTLTLCATVASVADAPTSGTRITFLWDAPYEGPGIGYTASATISAAGAVSNAIYAKGAAGTTLTQLGGGATAVLVGDTLRLSVPRSAVGDPQDGQSLAALAVRVESTALAAAPWDRAPDAGGVAFELGQRIADVSPPSAVSGLAIVDPATGSTLELSWTAATDDVGVVDHVVRRANAPGGPYRTVGLVAGTTFTDTDLEQDRAYHYRVAARDGAGNLGPASAEVSAVPTGVPVDSTPPSVPGDLAASDVTPYSLSLAWTPSVDAESPVVAYRVSRDGVLVATVEAPGHVASPLAPGTTYLYEVRAVNAEGLVSPPATLTVSTPELTPDCGQVAYQLAADPALDGMTRADGRADIVRVSVRETATRVYFHVGVRNLTADAPATLYRVAWVVNDAVGYAAYGRMTDDGPSVVGLFVVNRLTNQELKVGTNPLVSRSCDSLLIGIQKADVDELEDGVWDDLLVRATSNTTGAPASQVYDTAPHAPIDYALGTAV